MSLRGADNIPILYNGRSFAKRTFSIIFTSKLLTDRIYNDYGERLQVTGLR